MWAKSAYVGLAAPGDAGSWEKETKVDLHALFSFSFIYLLLLKNESVYIYIYISFNQGYQFWTQADEQGRFSIENVRQGDYNLYAWVPGIVGDYKYNLNVTAKPGKIFLPLFYYKAFVWLVWCD